MSLSPPLETMKVEIDLWAAKDLLEISRKMLSQLEIARGTDAYHHLSRIHAHLLANVIYAEHGPDSDDPR